MTTTGEWTALQGAIERLYRTFARYLLHDYIAGCPCCVSPADQAAIRSRPLRLLTTDDVGRYAGKAMTTWGTVDDYKHFLPRLLELVVADPVFNEAILAGKIRFAQCQQWPPRERDAIAAYLMSLWRYVLVCDDPQPLGRSIDDWICFIGGIVDDLSPFLRLWQDTSAICARQHLAGFINDNADTLLRKSALDSVWWKERAQQMRQVVEWLAQPQLQELLEDTFFAHEAQPCAEDLGRAADVLRWLHPEVMAMARGAQ